MAWVETFACGSCRRTYVCAYAGDGARAMGWRCADVRETRAATGRVVGVGRWWKPRAKLNWGVSVSVLSSSPRPRGLPHWQDQTDTNTSHPCSCCHATQPRPPPKSIRGPALPKPRKKKKKKSDNGEKLFCDVGRRWCCTVSTSGYCSTAPIDDFRTTVERSPHFNPPPPTSRSSTTLCTQDTLSNT